MGSAKAEPASDPAAATEPTGQAAGGTQDPAKTEGASQEKPGESKEQKQQSGAPETYADFKLPEGVEISPAAADEFKTVAKEIGLSQEAAQKLVDLQAKFVKSAADASLAQYQQTVESWKSETIKTLGPGYQKELGFAAKMIDRFGSPELRQLFNDTGFGNHPLVAAMLIKAGKAISEDSFVDGGKQAVPAKSAAELLYPNQK